MASEWFNFSYAFSEKKYIYEKLNFIIINNALESLQFCYGVHTDKINLQ
jgi:hypothetical protein